MPPPHGEKGQKRQQVPSTLRIELSWRVFFVSYPSSRQQRTVEPEPANSARFKSAKPSWEGERRLWEAAGSVGARLAAQGLIWWRGRGRQSPWATPVQTDCCITCTQGWRPGLVASVGGSNVAEPGAHIPEPHKAPFVLCPRVHRGSA